MKKKRALSSLSKKPPRVSCSLCGKKLADMRVLTEVDLELYSWYVRPSDTSLENMNGLWKKTAEFFCEDCFSAYVGALERFYAERRPVKA